MLNENKDIYKAYKCVCESAKRCEMKKRGIKKQTAMIEDGDTIECKPLKRSSVKRLRVLDKDWHSDVDECDSNVCKPRKRKLKSKTSRLVESRLCRGIAERLRLDESVKTFRQLKRCGIIH